MTVHDLLPASLALSKLLGGIYNFCNPGAISHNECLELYKHVDPTLYRRSLEEQDKILARYELGVPHGHESPGNDGRGWSLFEFEDRTPRGRAERRVDARSW